MGIKATVELDPNAMQDWKDGIVKKLTTGVKGLLRGAGAELMAGTATITGPNTVEVKLADGTTETVQATKAIVVATGATTIEIPTFKFDGTQVIGAKEAVSLRQIPKRLSSSAAGSSASSSGMVYQKFGSKLTVVEALPQILTGIDADCAKVVERKIVKRGGTIHTNAKAIGYEKQADGSLRVNIDLQRQDGDHRVRRRARRRGHAPALQGPRPRAGGRHHRQARLHPHRPPRPHQRPFDLRDRRRERPAAARAQGHEGGRGRSPR
jgi:dihydrolipoamide dehydrogenase